MGTDFSPLVGFQPPWRERARKRRRIALTQLLLTIALALSTVIALTAVSLGMAHADALGAIVRHHGTPLGVALLLGVVVALTVLATRGYAAHARR